MSSATPDGSVPTYSSIERPTPDDADDGDAPATYPPADVRDDGGLTALSIVSPNEETQSERRERLEREQFEREKVSLRAAMAECRLPFVDQVLIEKYVLRLRSDTPSTEQREMAHTLHRAMKRHHQATLAVLRAITVREATLDRLDDIARETRHAQDAGEAAARSAVKVDLQAQALRQLYLYREQTLAVVEAIVTWRANLNRPFAFVHQGRNYMLKINTDGARIDHGALGDLLPIQMVDHPLLASMPALNLFGGAAAATSAGAEHVRNTSPATVGGGKPRRATTAAPSRPLDRATAPPLSAAQQKRLLAAEAYIRGELDAQLALHRRGGGVSLAAGGDGGR